MPIKPLLKVLSQSGIGSRRQLAEAIRQGRVKVNGEVTEDFSHALEITTDCVTIDNQPVNIRPKKPVYLLLNKPAGVLSSTSDKRGRRTVIDILPDKYRQLGLHSVGRLDKNTTGLLLLTNDGELTYRLTHPKFEHEKEYLVLIEGILQPGEKRMLERGVTLADGVTHNAVVEEVNMKRFNYKMIIHEGRKRQVRRMFEHFGHRVIALKRVRMGTIRLGNLAKGGVRELTKQEIQRLSA